MKTKYLYLAIGLILYSSSLFCSYYILPEVSGAFFVGKQTIFLYDYTRKDPYLNLSYRPLSIDIYYPSDDLASDQAAYSQLAAAIILRECREFNYFNELNQVFLNVKTQSSYNLPISKSKNLFPVILFSHGYTHSNRSNTAQCEGLASHGFIVLAINHTGISGNAQLEDGSVIESCLAPRTVEAPLHMCDDIDFITNYLKLNSKKIPLLSRADISRIGIFGHSLGGMVATRCCARNQLLKAGVNLDGPLFGRKMYDSFYKPFLFLLAEDFEQRFSQDQQALDAMQITAKEFKEAIPSLIKEMSGFGGSITINGTSHNSFCDHSIIHNIFLQQHPQLALSLQTHLLVGSLNGREVHRIILEHLVTFFKKHLSP